MKKILLLSLIAMFFFSADAFALKRYWISTSTSNWNSTGNWSDANGGTGGFSVPISTDTAYFTSSKTGQCTLDVNASVKRWEMGSGCGTFSQGTYNLTVGTSGAVLSGGTFTGGSGTITLTGAFTNSGCAFTSTSGMLTSNSNFTHSGGSFSHNSGKMRFTATNTINATITMYQLEFAPTASATFTITSSTTLTITNTLTLSGSNGITLKNGDIRAEGDVVLSNTGTGGGGDATVTFAGNSNQTLDGSSAGNVGRLPSVVINKSGGTLYMQDIVPVFGDYTRTAGDTDPGSSTVSFGSTKTISGTDTLYNVNFGGGTHTVVNTINVLNDLTIAGSSGTIVIDDGTFNLKGDLISTNTSTSTAGDATIILNGTGNQSITGSGTAGQGKFPNMEINKSSGDLTLASVISVTGNWIFTSLGSGSCNPGTSTVFFYGNFNLDGTGSTTMSFNRIQIAGGTRTLTGSIDANENFVISSGATCVASTYTINVGGNWDNQGGTFTYNTSTVVFDGSAYKEIKRSSGSETFYNLTIDKSGSAAKAVVPVIVNNTLTLTAGRLRTNTTNYISLIAGASVSGGSNTAYVDGPLRKTGNTSFTFPVGDSAAASAAYHPLYMTAPSSGTDQFQAQYFASAQAYGTAKANTLNSVSTCEYWTFNRTFGSSTPSLSLGWNSNCDNGGYTEMRVGLWNGTEWTNLGQSSISIGGASSGTLVSTTATSFTVNPAPITICYAAVSKSYATMGRTPGAGFHTTDGNVLYFSFEEEYKDANGLLSYSIISLSTDRPVTLTANGLNTAAVAYGNNRYRIDLYDNTNTPLASGYYMLEVTNDKNEKWYLRFKI